MFALWINLHGSWVFGLVVMGDLHRFRVWLKASGATYVAERWTPVQLRELRNSICRLRLPQCWLTRTATNWCGIPLICYSVNSQSSTEIVEWQSVDFHTGYGKLAMLMIFALLAVTVLSRDRWELRDVLLVAFAIWTSLTHVRFLLFAAIVLIPILGTAGPRIRALRSEERQALAQLRDDCCHRGPHTVGISERVAAPEPASMLTFPRAALQFMQQKQINGRLFHFYDYGGYIEWNAPAVKTFADGRADIFIYNGVFDDYLKVNRIEKPLELLDKYKIDYVLFPVDKHLCYLLDHSVDGARSMQTKWQSSTRECHTAGAVVKAEPTNAARPRGIILQHTSQLPLEVRAATGHASLVDGAVCHAPPGSHGVFSFPVMCMFLLVAAIFAFSVRAIAEPDIWWHLRNARSSDAIPLASWRGHLLIHGSGVAFA